MRVARGSVCNSAEKSNKSKPTRKIASSPKFQAEIDFYTFQISMDWLDLQNPLDANSQFESIFSHNEF